MAPVRLTFGCSGECIGHKISTTRNRGLDTNSRTAGCVSVNATAVYAVHWCNAKRLMRRCGHKRTGLYRNEISSPINRLIAAAPAAPRPRYEQRSRTDMNLRDGYADTGEPYSTV